MSNYVKNMIKKISNISRLQREFETFKDFIFLSSYSIQNAVKFDEKIEAEYLNIAKKYNEKQLNSFAELLADLVIAMEDKIDDYLGALYMEANLSNKYTGQFFTPMPICNLISKVIFNPDSLKNKPYIIVNEPTCGAGAMILSFYNEIKNQGFNPQKKVLFVAQDIDPLVARICYIQMSIAGVAGYVMIGNSLDMNNYDDQSRLYTPVYCINNWHGKTQKAEFKNEPISIVNSLTPTKQASLF